MARSISREALAAKIDRGDRFSLVETLAPEHFAHGHLPGAINIPPDRVSALVPLLLPDKTSEVVLYCANVNCHASAAVAEELERRGYTNVWHYPGGKQDWMAAGMEVEGEQVPAARRGAQGESR